ncbi:hypothetical protein CRX72_17985 [Pantoea sp. BRM17]|nr:hypothetical protein CRX72_17985 [Pantoea sp. BRM17]
MIKNRRLLKSSLISLTGSLLSLVNAAANQTALLHLRMCLIICSDLINVYVLKAFADYAET